MNTEKRFCVCCGRVIARVPLHQGTTHRRHKKCLDDLTRYDHLTGKFDPEQLKKSMNEMNRLNAFLFGVQKIDLKTES
jgi:hypothetical protein